MSARERVLLGQFMRRRASHPDTAADELAPGGVLDPAKSFLERDLPSDGALVRTPPAPLPEMPPPALGRPAPDGPLSPPTVRPTVPARPQPSQDVRPAHPPAGPVRVPEPPRARPAAEQPHPTVPPTSPAGPQPPQGGGTGPGPLPAPPDFVHGPNAVIPLAAVPGNVPAAVLPHMPAPDHVGPARLPVQPSPAHRAEYAPGGALPPGRSPLDDVRSADARVLAALRDLGRYAPGVGLSLGAEGDLALDPLLYVRSTRRTGRDVARLALHVARQLALFAQNSRGRVWNPALVSPPPVAVDHLPPALDLPSEGDPPRDIHREMAEGTYHVDRVTPTPPFREAQVRVGSGGHPVGPRLVGADSQDSSVVDDPGSVAPGRSVIQAGLDQRNRYTSDRPYTENAVAKLEDLVAAAMDGRPNRFLTSDVSQTRYVVGLGHEPQSLSRVFEPERQPVSSPHSWRSRSATALGGSPFSSSPLAAAAFPNGVIPARVRGENDWGFAVSDSGRRPPVDDDDAYVPLSFTDLRPITGQKFRTVYFRPFITNLSEELSPQWNKANYYGRTDAVATYMATGRTVNLGFTLQAFSPEDVRVIYQKVNWLSSMVYPEYDRDLVIRSGPVVRMRVGDVIDALGPEGARGLPGIIESLAYDYSDSLWELRRDWKVPVTVKVTVGFTVLHDRPVGRGGLGKFGGVGTFKDGRYVPPHLQEQGPATPSGDFLSMEDRDTSFRQVGAGNEYTLENVLLDDSER